MSPPTLLVVGHCTATDARVFCGAPPARDGRPGVARLAWRSGDGVTGVADVELSGAPPYAVGVFELAGLPPSATLAYAVDVAGVATHLPAAEALLAGATRQFRLLPTGRPLRIALVSCNRASDEADERRRYALWRALGGEIARGRVDLVVHAGDQVYADAIWRRHDADPRNEGLTPADAARIDALAAEYRRLYAEGAWAAPDVAAVLGSCPSVMMWDDHEVYDGWGSNDAAAAPPQQAFFRAAARAFGEFQASHGPPRLDASSFACGFAHDGVGVLLLDTRSHRHYAAHTVLGEQQHHAVARWLEGATGLRRLYVVVSVPFVHVNATALLAVTEGLPFVMELDDDLRDLWVSPNNRAECRRLLLVYSGTRRRIQRRR